MIQIDFTSFLNFCIIIIIFIIIFCNLIIFNTFRIFNLIITRHTNNTLRHIKRITNITTIISRITFTFSTLSIRIHYITRFTSITKRIDNFINFTINISNFLYIISINTRVLFFTQSWTFFTFRTLSIRFILNTIFYLRSNLFTRTLSIWIIIIFTNQTFKGEIIFRYITFGNIFLNTMNYWIYFLKTIIFFTRFTCNFTFISFTIFSLSFNTKTIFLSVSLFTNFTTFIFIIINTIIK